MMMMMIIVMMMMCCCHVAHNVLCYSMAPRARAPFSSSNKQTNKNRNQIVRARVDRSFVLLEIENEILMPMMMLLMMLMPMMMIQIR